MKPQHQLDDLPNPPAGRTGWPWTEVSDPLPPTRSDGRAWPKISIVIPSLNQGRYIEETIRSILLQGYPSLELLVIDGGSEASTLEVINKYERYLDFFSSEPDSGQASAINKGRGLATGDIFHWINSDDFLLPAALGLVGGAYRPGAIITGGVLNFHDTDKFHPWVCANRNLSVGGLLNIEKSNWHQPGVWVPMSLWENCDPLSEDLNFYFDWLWTLEVLIRRPDTIELSSNLVAFRCHNESKTHGNDHLGRLQEYKVVLDRLRRDMRFVHYHDEVNIFYFAADRRSEQKKLQEIVEDLSSEKKRSKFWKVLVLCYWILRKPTLRFSRFSLGALRRL